MRCSRQTLSRASRFDRGHGSGGDSPFNLENYVEAEVEHVRSAEQTGHVVLLRLLDGKNSQLAVYIGDAECSALVKEIQHRQTARPLTHDLFKDTLLLLGYKVTKVAVTSLVGNTYHAHVHIVSSSGDKEVAIDARPSDAINLAVRFKAPLYVNKDVAAMMARSPAETAAAYGLSTALSGANRDMVQSHSDVVMSCREEMAQHVDPTIMYKLNLQLAIAQQDFQLATELRNKIESMIRNDRALALMVAMESALDDHRYEDASWCCDELKKLRQQNAQSRYSTGSAESSMF